MTSIKRIVQYISLLVVLFSVVVPPSHAFADDTTVGTVPVTPIEDDVISPLPAPIAVTTPSPQVVTPTSPAIIMTSFATSDYVDFVELYNQSSNPIDMASVQIIVHNESATPQTLTLPVGWLLPKHYVTFAQFPDAIAGSVAFVSSQNPSVTIQALDVLVAGIKVQSTGIPDSLTWAQHKQRGNVTLKQTGDFATDFKSMTGVANLFSSSLYQPPLSDEGLRINEILANARSCSPTETASDCGDYIEIVNPTEHDINLAQYRVRVGVKGSSVGITNAFTWHEPTLDPQADELILQPGAYFLLNVRNDGAPLSLAAGGNYVWIEDFYGTKIYSEMNYPDMSSVTKAGVVWAYDSDHAIWQESSPSPAAENTFATVIPEPVSPTLTPCRDDQYRSEETNRCRNSVTAAASSLIPCKDGQYRSEETNRCRTIATMTSTTLKPCADDQFRNPATGRCKKIASADDVALADCGEGRERNPETNRCRNITALSVPEAAFAVEPVKETGTAFVGWWALGGVGVLALGYAGWEWRQEMLVGIRKIGTFFTSRK